MDKRKPLPIGNDEFREVRERGYYYIDKSLMIRDFLEMGDKVALIARPRRFGKTLNMTMMREFFDITVESSQLFDGLAIMKTSYAEQMNSCPVIFLTLKNCKGATADELIYTLKKELLREFLRYETVVEKKLDHNSYDYENYRDILNTLKDKNSSYIYLTTSLVDLTRIVAACYHICPILLIDEYDQPIMSSYEYNYHDALGVFFSTFFGAALKGNQSLGQALLTGIQRVAKESIFSQLNNPKVYTVMSHQYASYFGLTASETEMLLKDYGLSLTTDVQQMYDGYLFSGIEMYNPWSILNYADNAFLDNYWTNTSSNYLIRQALGKASASFWKDFDVLATGAETTVWLNLDTSYVERESNYSLWGLLVNAGYLTVLQRNDATSTVVKIPNNEVMNEFLMIVTEISGLEGQGLSGMFSALLSGDIERFLLLYQEAVISCTSYMDAKENAYHMLMLGMCMTLRGSYEVTSNLETGLGRSDITLRALIPNKPHIIIEFKQGTGLDTLAKEALDQIMKQEYYHTLRGNILCIGLAHDKKQCKIEYKMINN